MDLHGKTVLVTGASSGVGLAAAEEFARAGCDVALMSRTRAGLETAAERVRDAGGRAVIVPADLTDREAVAAGVQEAVRALGGLDVLCQCAAITVFGAFEEVRPEDFDRVVAFSFTGAVNVVRAALGHLERSDGTIVAMGSLMSKLPLPQLSSYAAAKHAERGFLNTLDVELRSRGSGVRVAMLHPGAINTPIWGEMPTASGSLPRRPPEAYSAHEVAKELVALARRPVAERTFGLETKAIELLWSVARPAGDVAMILIDRYFRSGRRTSGAGVEALREGHAEGVVDDGMPFPRPSLTRLIARAF